MEDYIAEVIFLVNQERAYAGCPPLTPNDTLLAVAQAHCIDMAYRDFFGHVNPDGRSPFDRMQAAGYPTLMGAENIAGGYATPADVVAGWMNSPGHRANILNGHLRETGVGFIRDPGYKLRLSTFWVQVFGTPMPGVR